MTVHHFVSLRLGMKDVMVSQSSHKSISIYVFYKKGYLHCYLHTCTHTHTHGTVSFHVYVHTAVCHLLQFVFSVCAIWHTLSAAGLIKAPRYQHFEICALTFGPDAIITGDQHVCETNLASGSGPVAHVILIQEVCIPGCIHGLIFLGFNMLIRTWFFSHYLFLIS